MYKQKFFTENNLEYIELLNSNGSTKAKLCLGQGGRLSELMVDDVKIVKKFHSLTYNETYASSIMFPFVNRVKNGMYEFENNEYKLDCNENGRNHALHGLVFNKRFDLESSLLTSDFGAVTLRYKSDGSLKGFPFKFLFFVTYKLHESKISLTIKVVNLDVKSFPFTIGWHPYFTSSDLYKSTLKFKCKNKVLLDNEFITSGMVDCFEEVSFQVKDKELNDAYILMGNQVRFKTPEYGMIMHASSKENYLQLYTPENSNTLAIEPMIGVSDSFNNKLGLQTLKPNEEYRVSWCITIEK